MVVWGGDDAEVLEETGYAPVDPHPIGTGGRYDPAGERWNPMSTNDAPSARFHHTAIWTGSEMIIWGGVSETSTRLADGGRYDPRSDRWLGVSMNGLVPRSHHTAVWSGTEMIVFGGIGQSGEFLTEPFAFNPTLGTFRTLSTTDAPSARIGHTAVWTGREMIVWGGHDVRSPDAGSALASGARYDPATDRWTPLSTEGAPSARSEHVAVWTGSEMLVWGGTTPPSEGRLASGARFDPASGSWRPMGASGACARHDERGVWVGDRLVVLGEAVATSDELYPPPNVGIYDPIEDSWEMFGAGAAGAAFGRPIVFAGDEVLMFGGFDGNNITNAGYGISIPIRVSTAP
jgi:N-acetylneuraminic acid mutarotase